MTGFARAPAITLSIALFGGCSDATRPNAAIEDDIVTRICDARARCSCGPDLATCRLDVAQRVQAAFDEAAAGDLEVDAVCIETGLASLEDMGCRTLADLSRDESAGMYNDLLCNGFHGAKTEDEACSLLEFSDGTDCDIGLECRDERCAPERPWPAVREGCYIAFVECAGDSTCATDPSTQSLTCLPTAQEGEPCAGVEGVCGTGLTCEAQACQPAPALGEPCAEEINGANMCASGLYCNDGLCAAPGGLGTPCQGSLACEPDLFCSGATAQCEIREPIPCTFERVP